ncbi:MULTISPECIES: DUF4359 domain-containing protein [unclassified Cyanobium]|uniref:DUF4359 domain-containing protein n=1 Tax=unclassified Cyanobium TaxID=2627006 RepID=UPI0020CD3FC7|nr:MULTISPECIES: DUF4359 domain-containing protein [unclassified Cyanobium]MCP9833786.1 DUF4359 domain-containing protein [Cyanobium sp. La Preciosa 7G6]MCP9936456.1 DUF4359 domain-containing protein [Cyanobium sp. Aljojuca 7A6]
MPPPTTASRTVSRLLGLTAVSAGLIGLAITNPGPAAFEEFAAEKLTEMASKELCQNEGLPLLARLLIQNCPELVRSQRKVLGRLARDNSRRYNFGLLSLYGTRLGGEKVLPNWSIPRYDAVTLAVAGHFVLLTASESAPGSPVP